MLWRQLDSWRLARPPPGLSACCGVQVPASACKRRGECVQMHANAWPGLAWPALRAGPAWPALRRLGGGGRATTAGGGRRPAGCFPLASATQSGRSGGLLDTSSLPHCRRRLFGMVQRVGTWGIRDSAGRAEVVNLYHCSLIRPSPCDLKVGRFCTYLSKGVMRQNPLGTNRFLSSKLWPSMRDT